MAYQERMPDGRLARRAELTSGNPALTRLNSPPTTHSPVLKKALLSALPGLKLPVDQLPSSAALLGTWPLALAWVAYRTADSELLERALAARQAALPAFEAFRASLQEQWAETLKWSDEALRDQGALGLPFGWAVD
jgi:hypothetical protein